MFPYAEKGRKIAEKEQSGISRFAVIRDRRSRQTKRSEKILQAGFAGGPEGRRGGAVGIAEFEAEGLFVTVNSAGGEVHGGGAEGEARQATGALLGGDGKQILERGMVAEVDEGGRLGTEVGADDARLERDGGNPAVAVATLQFAGEKDIAEFRPSVGAEGGKIPLAFGIGGIEVGAEEVRRDARGLDHRGVRRRKFLKQETGEQKGREQIDLKGALEAVAGQFSLLLRAAGVVRQNVDLFVGVQFPGETHDVRKTRVVGEVIRTAEFVGYPLGFFGVASDDDYVVSRLYQRPRRGGADPVAAPCDDDGFPVFSFHTLPFRPAVPRRGAVVKISVFQIERGAPGIRGRRISAGSVGSLFRRLLFGFLFRRSGGFLRFLRFDLGVPDHAGNRQDDNEGIPCDVVERLDDLRPTPTVRDHDDREDDHQAGHTDPDEPDDTGDLPKRVASDQPGQHGEDRKRSSCGVGQEREHVVEDQGSPVVIKVVEDLHPGKESGDQTVDGGAEDQGKSE